MQEKSTDELDAQLGNWRNGYHYPDENWRKR